MMSDDIVLGSGGCYAMKEQLLQDVYEIYDKHRIMINELYVNDEKYVDNKPIDKRFYEVMDTMRKQGKSVEEMDEFAREYFPHTEWKNAYYDAKEKHWNTYNTIVMWVMNRFD
jgi:hypothetical protein